MFHKLKVAVLQMNPVGTTEENMEKGILFCKKAKETGADIALFPEMWTTGYTMAEDPEVLKQMATAADDPLVTQFGKLAQELNMAIGITLLEQHDPMPRNTFLLYDRYGREVLRYAKVHTCDFHEECLLSRGEDFYVTDLDTEQGSVCVGAMICYDREFPESARILMLKGAELILVPNACPMEINRLSQIRSRAYENMVAIVVCNYADQTPDCNGHSSAFDGIAYDGRLYSSDTPKDMKLFEADGREAVFFAEIDLEELRIYRKTEKFGNAFRRPDRYALLLENTIHPPFLRQSRRTVS